MFCGIKHNDNMPEISVLFVVNMDLPTIPYYHTCS